MKKTKTSQERFMTAMLGGKQLTVAQIRGLGLANPYDAAYKARQAGVSVQRALRTSKNGVHTSVYALEA